MTVSPTARPAPAGLSLLPAEHLGRVRLPLPFCGVGPCVGHFVAVLRVMAIVPLRHAGITITRYNADILSADPQFKYADCGAGAQQNDSTGVGWRRTRRPGWVQRAGPQGRRRTAFLASRTRSNPGSGRHSPRRHDTSPSLRH